MMSPRSKIGKRFTLAFLAVWACLFVLTSALTWANKTPFRPPKRPIVDSGPVGTPRLGRLGGNIPPDQTITIPNMTPKRKSPVPPAPKKKVEAPEPATAKTPKAVQSPIKEESRKLGAQQGELRKQAGAAKTPKAKEKAGKAVHKNDQDIGRSKAKADKLEATAKRSEKKKIADQQFLDNSKRNKKLQAEKVRAEGKRVKNKKTSDKSFQQKDLKTKKVARTKQEKVRVADKKKAADEKFLEKRKEASNKKLAVSRQAAIRRRAREFVHKEKLDAEGGRKGKSVAGGGEGVLTTIPRNKSLSTLRKTGPGETFVRFESADVRFTKVTAHNGLKSGAFAAPMSELPVPLSQRATRFNLPDPQILRTRQVDIQTQGDLVIGPRSVSGGTGNEVLFPFGAKPGTVKVK